MKVSTTDIYIDSLQHKRWKHGSRSYLSYSTIPVLSYSEHVVNVITHFVFKHYRLVLLISLKCILLNWSAYTQNILQHYTKSLKKYLQLDKEHDYNRSCHSAAMFNKLTITTSLLDRLSKTIIRFYIKVHIYKTN